MVQPSTIAPTHPPTHQPSKTSCAILALAGYSLCCQSEVKNQFSFSLQFKNRLTLSLQFLRADALFGYSVYCQENLHNFLLVLPFKIGSLQFDTRKPHTTHPPRGTSCAILVSVGYSFCCQADVRAKCTSDQNSFQLSFLFIVPL